MDESLVEEPVHDTIECCLIHLTRIDKGVLQHSERSGFLPLEQAQDMSAMYSGKHKKLQKKS